MKLFSYIFQSFYIICNLYKKMLDKMIYILLEQLIRIAILTLTIYICYRLAVYLSNKILYFTPKTYYRTE